MKFIFGSSPAFLMAAVVAAWSFSGCQTATPPPAFSGLGTDLGNLHRLSHARSRSISAENPTGEPGQAGRATEGFGKEAASELGQGWKVAPFLTLKAHQENVLAEITGPGAIQQIWMPPAWRGPGRLYILRCYWDNEREPSVEVPLDDFFACGWGTYSQISSLAVCVNPYKGCNCYWTMPFRQKARITLENLTDEDCPIGYQINYTLTDVPADAGYFHAQFRRVKRLPEKTPYTIVDGIRGQGHYVGVYLAWEAHSPGWWGEGEIKFYLDGDTTFPTLCGTGTEDYFGGAWDFEDPVTKRYVPFSSPYSGLVHALPPDRIYVPGQRFGLYRWHITDPVRFEQALKVTIQALGWKKRGQYLALQDDIASVVYWYQTEPHAKFPPLPARDDLLFGPLEVAPAKK